jgi:hypothetical protein
MIESEEDAFSMVKSKVAGFSFLGADAPKADRRD